MAPPDHQTTIHRLPRPMDDTKRRAPRKGLQIAQVERDLRALYLLQPEVLAEDHNLFRNSVDEYLTDAIYTIQQWVRS